MSSMKIDNIDFTDIKSAKSEDKLLVYGYIRSNFKSQTSTKSSENIVNYTILAFYYDHCDIFNTFIENYDISPDGKCFSGCGYGKYEVDPNNNRYNRYQWMIKMNSCARGSPIIFGITPSVNTNKPWCFDMEPNQYNFHSYGDFCPMSSIKDGFKHLCVENTEFHEKDSIIILDLNVSTKEFKLFINGKLGGCHKNINLDRRDIKYRLGCLVSDGINFITIEGFSKFKDDDKNVSNNMNMNNLLNYKGGYSHRYHPNGILNLDYNNMERIGSYPCEYSECKLFRSWWEVCNDHEWEWYYWRIEQHDYYIKNGQFYLA